MRPRAVLASGSSVSSNSKPGVAVLPTFPRFGGYENVVQLQVGSPAQTIEVLIDTGSCLFWTISSLIPKNESALLNTLESKAPLFDPSRSTTFKNKTNSHWDAGYVDQHGASGFYGIDRVSFGGVVDDSVVLRVATRANWQNQPDRGVLGLSPPCQGRPGSQVKSERHLVERLHNKGLIRSAIFSITLVSGSQGRLTLGEVDTTSLKGKVHYVPAIPHLSTWSVYSPCAIVDGVKISREKGNQALIDTGSSHIFVSDALVHSIYSKIAGSELTQDGWVYPNASKLPTVELAIDEFVYRFPKGHFAVDYTLDGRSIGAFQPRGDFPSDMFGGVFFRSVVAVFDVQNHRVGFARRKDVQYDA